MHCCCWNLLQVRWLSVPWSCPASVGGYGKVTPNRQGSLGRPTASIMSTGFRASSVLLCCGCLHHPVVFTHTHTHAHTHTRTLYRLIGVKDSMIRCPSIPPPTKLRLNTFFFKANQQQQQQQQEKEEEEEKRKKKQEEETKWH